MEENKTPRACPKDCRMCSMQQQVYCAAQMSFNAFEVMSSIITRLENVEQTITCLKSQSDELSVPDNATKETTQKGSGVKE